MSFKFRMYAVDGDDLGDYESVVPDCNPGDTLYIDGRPKYRISAVIPVNSLDNDVYAAIWEVEPLIPTSQRESASA